MFSNFNPISAHILFGLFSKKQLIHCGGIAKQENGFTQWHVHPSTDSSSRPFADNIFIPRKTIFCLVINKLDLANQRTCNSLNILYYDNGVDC